MSPRICPTIIRPPLTTPRSQTLLEEQRADPFYAVWADALAALLASPYHVFWSCIAHDESLRRFLDSFLRLFVRPSEPAFAIVLRNARRKRVFEDVFRVYWRAGQRTEARPQGPALHMEAPFYNKLIAEVRRDRIVTHTLASHSHCTCTHTRTSRTPTLTIALHTLTFTLHMVL